MSYTIDSEYGAQLFLAFRTFRTPADEDYLLARWCNFTRLNYQFYWHAQQAIEKYLKCALYLNSQSVREENHDLGELLKKARDVFGDLIPLELMPPFENLANSGHKDWGNFDSIIAKYDSVGNTSNRYRLFSTDSLMLGIHGFDEICFSLRRLCVGLQRPSADPKIPNDKYLRDFPRYQYGIEQLLEESNALKAKALKRQNFSFCPKEALDDGTFTRTLIPDFENSPIYNLMEVDNESTRDVLRDYIERVKIPSEALKEIKRYLETGTIEIKK